MDRIEEEEVKESNHAAAADDQSEEEELKEFDAAALQLLEFLGQVYVSLSEFKAREEYACEQYAASIRFVRRCLSESTDTDALSRDNLTSRKNLVSNSSRQSTLQRGVRTPVQQNSRITHEQIDQTTVREEEINGKRLQDIQSLCDSIDSVLAEAGHVREKSKRGTMSKTNKIQNSHQKSGGNGDLLSVEKTSSGVKAAASKPVSNKAMVVSKTGERPKKFVQRKSIQVPGRPSRPQKPSPALQEATRDLENNKVGTGVTFETSEECNQPQINSEFAKDKKKESIVEPASTGKKKWSRSSLQFPEEITALHTWFKSRGMSWNDPPNILRTESRAAKESFLLVFNDISNEHRHSYNKEARDAAVRIQETQKVLKDLACHVSPSEMSRFLRISPGGPTAVERGDIEMQRVLMSQQAAINPSSLGRYHVSNSRILNPLHDQVTTLSWLPQNCWEYFGRAVESLKSGGSKEITDMLQKRVIHCTEREKIVVTTRLWHAIHVTLLQCYLEEVVAVPLLPKLCTPRNEMNLLNLFRCRLVHSILCKEGSGLLVIAERTMTPY